MQKARGGTGADPFIRGITGSWMWSEPRAEDLGVGMELRVSLTFRRRARPDPAQWV